MVPVPDGVDAFHGIGVGTGVTTGSGVRAGGSWTESEAGGPPLGVLVGVAVGRSSTGIPMGMA